MKKIIGLLLTTLTLSLADMAQLFNIERYHGTNPAVLTQLEDEGILAVVQAKSDSFSESFNDTETSKINTMQLKVSIYEVEGDWVYHASINEAVSGTQNDPRNQFIDNVGIFVENLSLSAAKMISRELSVGASYELHRFGTYDSSKDFVTGRQNLWLSELDQRAFAGVTYAITGSEYAGAVAGIDTFHSNHINFGWRFFAGVGISTYRFDEVSLELSTTLYPRQYTVGDTLASNFMPRYWKNEVQILADLNPLKIALILNVDLEESLEGIIVNGATSNKLITRMELQVKKQLERQGDFLFFAAFEKAVQDNYMDTRVIAGISYSQNFD